MLTKEEEELGIDWRRNLRAEGMQRIVLAQLSERFGPISEQAQQRIEMSTQDELTDLGRRLLKARSLEELGL